MPKLGKLALAAVLLLSAVSAAAGGFIPVSDSDPFPLLNKSVFSFRNNDSGGGCTGTKLTEDGDVLTAFHCLKECLFKQNWFDTHEDTANLSGEAVRVFRQTRAHAPVTCKLLVPFMEVQVIDAPKCIAYVLKENGDLGRVSESAPGDCDKSQDVLTFRMQQPEFLKDLTCAPLSSGPAPHVNDRVFSVGYPSATFFGKEDSDGKNMYRSRGRVMRQQSCEWTSPNGGRLRSSFPFEVGLHVLQVSVSAVPRSSGSPLFNRYGEIIGVASGIYSPLMSPGSYCAGGVFFSNLSRFDISQDLKRGNSACTKSLY